jgi:hypothetical protein
MLLLFFFIIIGGVGLSPLGTAATSGLLYKPQMIDSYSYLLYFPEIYVHRYGIRHYLYNIIIK